MVVVVCGWWLHCDSLVGRYVLAVALFVIGNWWRVPLVWEDIYAGKGQIHTWVILFNLKQLKLKSKTACAQRGWRTWIDPSGLYGSFRISLASLSPPRAGGFGWVGGWVNKESGVVGWVGVGKGEGV